MVRIAVVAARMCVNSIGVMWPLTIMILHFIMIQRKMDVLRSSGSIASHSSGSSRACSPLVMKIFASFELAWPRAIMTVISCAARTHRPSWNRAADMMPSPFLSQVGSVDARHSSSALHVAQRLV